MGGSVGKFVGDIAKAGLKGATSALGNMIPFVGGPLAQYINSKYAKGGVLLEVGGTPPDLPEGFKSKEIRTPAQLKSLIQKFPEEAKKAGLTIEKVDEEVKEAKIQMKAIGGMIGNRRTTTEIPDNIPLGPPTYKVKMMATGGKLTKDMKEDKQKPCMATGGQPKVKKARTPAQLEATKRLVEANRKRREKK